MTLGANEAKSSTATTPRAVFFGASALGKRAIVALGEQYEVVAFIDNDSRKWGTTWMGRPVHGPDFLVGLPGPIEVIVTSSYRDEIVPQLKALGIQEPVVLDDFMLRDSIEASERGGGREPDILDQIGWIRNSFGETLALIASLGHQPATVIDVGVAFGTPELYAAFPESSLILIEPLKEFSPYMELIVASRDDVRYMVAAAGAADGEVDITVTPDRSTSSLRVLDLGVRRRVPAVRVDSLCRRWSAKPPFALKVDVQGAELVVMDGATGILADTSVVILETSFWGNSDVPGLYEIIRYMDQCGFVPYDIVGGHNRPIDGARAQADVVFVQEKGPLRAERRWCTPKQREAFLNAKRRRAGFRAVMDGV